jgi:hypothetical protein
MITFTRVDMEMETLIPENTTIIVSTESEGEELERKTIRTGKELSLETFIKKSLPLLSEETRSTIIKRHGQTYAVRVQTTYALRYEIILIFDNGDSLL